MLVEILYLVKKLNNSVGFMYNNVTFNISDDIWCERFIKWMNDKISLLDSRENIWNKIKKAYCVSGDINCGLMILVEKIVFGVLKRLRMKFVINREVKYGGVIEYEEFDALPRDFMDDKLAPEDLKLGVCGAGVGILNCSRYFVFY